MSQLVVNHDKAREAVRRAVKDGVLLKPKACSKCSDEPEVRKLHGHHEDYTRPLDVIWLCVSCHVNLHFPNRVGKQRYINDKYTQVKIPETARDRLKAIAQREKRSMARMLEVLIDEAITTNDLIEKDYKGDK